MKEMSAFLAEDLTPLTYSFIKILIPSYNQRSIIIDDIVQTLVLRIKKIEIAQHREEYALLFLDFMKQVFSDYPAKFYFNRAYYDWSHHFIKILIEYGSPELQQSFVNSGYLSQDDQFEALFSYLIQSSKSEPLLIMLAQKKPLAFWPSVLQKLAEHKKWDLLIALNEHDEWHHPGIHNPKIALYWYLIDYYFHNKNTLPREREKIERILLYNVSDLINHTNDASPLLVFEGTDNDYTLATYIIDHRDAFPQLYQKWIDHICNQWVWARGKKLTIKDFLALSFTRLVDHYEVLENALLGQEESQLYVPLSLDLPILTQDLVTSQVPVIFSIPLKNDQALLAVSSNAQILDASLQDILLMSTHATGKSLEELYKLLRETPDEIRRECLLFLKNYDILKLFERKLLTTLLFFKMVQAQYVKQDSHAVLSFLSTLKNLVGTEFSRSEDLYSHLLQICPILLEHPCWTLWQYLVEPLSYNHKNFIYAGYDLYHPYAVYLCKKELLTQFSLNKLVHPQWIYGVLLSFVHRQYWDEMQLYWSRAITSTFMYYDHYPLDFIEIWTAFFSRLEYERIPSNILDAMRKTIEDHVLHSAHVTEQALGAFYPLFERICGDERKDYLEKKILSGHIALVHMLLAKRFIDFSQARDIFHQYHELIAITALIPLSRDLLQIKPFDHNQEMASFFWDLQIQDRTILLHAFCTKDTDFFPSLIQSWIDNRQRQKSYSMLEHPYLPGEFIPQEDLFLIICIQDIMPPEECWRCFENSALWDNLNNLWRSSQWQLFFQKQSSCPAWIKAWLNFCEKRIEKDQTFFWLPAMLDSRICGEEDLYAMIDLCYKKLLPKLLNQILKKALSKIPLTKAIDYAWKAAISINHTELLNIWAQNYPESLFFPCCHHPQSQTIASFIGLCPLILDVFKQSFVHKKIICLVYDNNLDKIELSELLNIPLSTLALWIDLNQELLKIHPQWRSKDAQNFFDKITSSPLTFLKRKGIGLLFKIWIQQDFAIQKDWLFKPEWIAASGCYPHYFDLWTYQIEEEPSLLDLILQGDGLSEYEKKEWIALVQRHAPRFFEFLVASRYFLETTEDPKKRMGLAF